MQNKKKAELFRQESFQKNILTFKFSDPLTYIRELFYHYHRPNNSKRIKTNLLYGDIRQSSFGQDSFQEYSLTLFFFNSLIIISHKGNIFAIGLYTNLKRIKMNLF